MKRLILILFLLFIASPTYAVEESKVSGLANILTGGIINGPVIIRGSLDSPFNHYSSGNSPVTMTDRMMSVNCDASGGAATFNLMSSSTASGRPYEFTITAAGGNKCYINPIGAETLNGFTNYSGLDVAGESILIRATPGSTWDWTIKGSF